MLHMIVMSHGPETCAGANAEARGKASNGFSQLNAAAKAKDVTVQGAWVDAPAHLIYALVDAPNAHVINDLMRELQFFHWNTIDIHPLEVIEEVVARMETLP